jgi:3',5'-cyclic AMP phosphodiesterase CpdA
MTRIAHATDLHWFVPPTWRRLLGKRTLGTANLYVRGRVHHFSRDVQRAAVAQLCALEPDVVVITGDLTAQALPREFELAREDLAPVLDRFPTLVMNGNHDVYTLGSARKDRISRHFRPWLHRLPSGIARLDVAGVTLIGLDPCRPHWSASGVVPQQQLDALEGTLARGELDAQPWLLALHYPILHPSGVLYDRLCHGLRNAQSLIDVLRRAPRAPSAILHGHRHHGYTVDLDVGDSTVPIFNPGAGGQAYEVAQDRAACVNLYTIGEAGAVDVQRYRHDGDRFCAEPGGAYATGR